MEYSYNIDGFSIVRNVNQTQKSMPNLHSHKEYEFYYLIGGKRKYFMNDTLYSINEGDFILTPPNLLHKSVGDEGPNYTNVVINVPMDMFEPSLLLECDMDKAHVFNIPAKRRKQFEHMLEKLEYEYSRNGSHSSYLIKNYVNEILVFLIRLKLREDFAYEVNEVDKIINEATKYIRENYEKTLTLSTVAKEIMVSSWYFSKLFKRKTGENFSEYLAKIRINEASKMLMETNLSITEIAMRCGFNDSAYFASVFKKINGVTPVKYRNSLGV